MASTGASQDPCGKKKQCHNGNLSNPATATGTMNITNVVKVAPFFLWKWSALRSSGDLVCYKQWFLLLHVLQITCQSSSQLHSMVGRGWRGGTSVHCIHCCLVLVVVSLEPHSFSGRVVLSLQSFRNGQNHSLNNIPWNLACAYCPVSPSCEPGNPAGHTLFVCCLPQCYVCLFQANHCCCCWKH